MCNMNFSLNALRHHGLFLLNEFVLYLILGVWLCVFYIFDLYGV